MKTLLALRHAKSSWGDPSLDDHERPLNKRGERAAPRMGRLLLDEGLVPDVILSSTAVRARTTAKMVAEVAEFSGRMSLRDDLYLAPPSRIVAVVAELDDTVAERVMVVAHNPGMAELVAGLTGAPEVSFPTAALAQIELDIESWSELARPVDGRLVQLWRPKELVD